MDWIHSISKAISHDIMNILSLFMSHLNGHCVAIPWHTTYAPRFCLAGPAFLGSWKTNIDPWPVLRVHGIGSMVNYPKRWVLMTGICVMTIFFLI